VVRAPQESITSSRRCWREQAQSPEETRAALNHPILANIDTVFLVHPIDSENLRRIERELSLVWDSGAVPAIVLTKADLAEEPDAARSAVEAVAVGCDVLVTSAVDGLGVESLLCGIEDQKTAVLLGPSGAGKSTLHRAARRRPAGDP
jgi:ribosome biogenesis GTPase